MDHNTAAQTAVAEVRRAEGLMDCSRRAGGRTFAFQSAVDAQTAVRIARDAANDAGPEHRMFLAPFLEQADEIEVEAQDEIDRYKARR